MSRVAIGICVHAEPLRLRATVAAVRATTAPDVELLLLPDGADEHVRAALAQFSDLPQLATAEPLGAAACFNRLATRGAVISVLLESGAEPGPRWLDYLVAALEEDSRNALAGPTTNRSWNEQGVFRSAGGGLDDVVATAREAERRFAGEVQLLEPLHSLADFCYVVRRDVIDAIGSADEGYGLGPCWEMDYNIRAARAGFRGVWARTAYVYRSPFTARRRIEEARRFESSKRRYQDKFCGARLQGRKLDYRPHCRGDACPDFAPPSLISIRPLLRAPRTDPAGMSSGPTPVVTADLSAPTPPFRESSPGTEHGEPLVTCVMATSNRRAALRQAIRCFLSQDYPNAELIVMDDGAEPVADCIPEDPRFRYVRLDGQVTIGTKRNIACAQARGGIIVHWDENVWYPPWRVGVQVRALMEGRAALCGGSRILCHEPLADRTWERRCAAGPSHSLAGATLAYRREFWQRNRCRDAEEGDDEVSVWASDGDAIVDLADRRLCIVMLPSGAGSRADASGPPWHPQPNADVHALLGDDVHFYRTIHAEVESARWPMVSCIMPTYNRRSLVPLAIQLFLRQDYPNRELIIVDDGDDAIGDMVPVAADVRYFRLPSRRRIGAKRNFACQQARGDIIAHWDDDDWYAPERLRYQIAPLLAGQADLTGLQNAFVLEPASGQFWTTNHDLHRRMFVGDVHGGTLVFWNQLVAEGLHYPEVNLGEDASLLRSALKRGKRLLRLSNPGMFVYMRHGNNAWRECMPGRFINPAGWQRITRPSTVPASVLSSYRAAIAATGITGK